MSSGSHATNPVIYGSHTNSFVLKGHETVEIILNNNDDGVCFALAFPPVS
jgi:iron transport multicopper oxidase